MITDTLNGEMEHGAEFISTSLTKTHGRMCTIMIQRTRHLRYPSLSKSVFYFSTYDDWDNFLDKPMPKTKYEIVSTPKQQSIYIVNKTKKYEIDEDAIRKHIQRTMNLLNVGDFTLDVTLCSEAYMRELKYEFMDMRKATDILSLTENNFERPGKIKLHPMFDMEGMKHLGDIYISPRYIERICRADKKKFDRGLLDNSQDRGVSLAMSKVFTFRERLPLLLVHGLLHLVGYDHETEKDWKLMTAKEEEILSKLLVDDAVGS